MSQLPAERLLLYLHYDAQSRLDPHVLYQLQGLKQVCAKIIFISNSRFPASANELLAPLVDQIVTRKNKGFDFGAWQETLLALGKEQLAAYTELLLMNSGTYGPFFPLEEMFAAMQAQSCDFWGLTRDDSTRYKKTGDIQVRAGEHLQGYFVVFKPRLFLSDCFWNFWRQLPHLSNFTEAILLGELAMTRVFSEAGFTHTAYADLPFIKPMPAIGVDEPLVYTAAPLLLSRYHVPFIKIKAFRTAPGKQYNHAADIFAAIRQSGSDYPVGLIDAHLTRAKPLSWSKNKPGFLNIFATEGAAPENPGLKLAVFAHSYYADSLAIILRQLEKLPYAFDLYLSTSEAKKQELLKKLAKAQLPARVAKLELRALPNRGRDVAPWILGFKDVQTNYDLALKFHVKKKISFNETFLQKWVAFINDCTLGTPGYIGRIAQMFSQRPNIGIAFHPYVPAWLLHTHSGFTGTHDVYKAYELSLKKCGIKPHRETSFPIFPTNIFWYRPSALRRLFESEIDWEDFPEEPCSDDGTLAHGLERSIPQIVHAGGFEVVQIMPKRLLRETYQQYEDHLLNLECAGWIKKRQNAVAYAW